jgi:signal transduction histidine kinase
VRVWQNNFARQREAEQALRDKNQFLTTASHDLRQPVHAMGFLIEAIIHKNSNDALMPQLLDLQQSVRSVQLMFNSLLDLSKIESGNMMTTTTHVDIGALLDSVITLFREEAKSRGLKLRTWRPGRRIYVMGDRWVRQSLINLIQNALRYTPRGCWWRSARAVKRVSLKCGTPGWASPMTKKTKSSPLLPPRTGVENRQCRARPRACRGGALRETDERHLRYAVY